MEELLKSVINKDKIEAVIREDLEDAIEHGVMVSNLAFQLSKELGESEEFCNSIALAGMTHDIGKLRLSRYLYGRRKDTLKVEEMKYVRMHSQYSYDILKNQGFPEWILDAVYHHHENFDGTGYPDNLKGEAISLGARILRICDVFSALVSYRPYRDAFSVEAAMELMIDEIKNFDMKIFLAFQRIVNSEEFGKIQKIIDNYNYARQNDSSTKK